LKKSIVSVSRRTDIPAFFGDWFVQQLEKGHTTVYHPYKHKRITVSLEPQDVAAFVFWSKDYRPFWNYLDVFDRRGYSFVFHYTITGLPSIFEPKVPSAEESCQTLKLISQRYSPQHITWRYDPIIPTDLTPPDYHIDKFRDLCKQLEGYTKRCYISFVNLYSKVLRSLKNYENNFRIIDLPVFDKIQMSQNLATIASEYGISMSSCCNKELVGGGITKGHCVDVDLLHELFGINKNDYELKPSRKYCGCYESIDIGSYNTCKHGCIYCYANRSSSKSRSTNKQPKKQKRKCYKQLSLDLNN
jgi:DNA repair photolyase